MRAIVGDLPLTKVASPEGVAKVSFRLPHPLTNRAFLLYLLQNNRDTQALKAPKVGVTDQDRIPEGDDGNLRVRQTVWKHKAIQAELREERRRSPPKIVKQREACDSGRSVQVGLSYSGKLPNTPNVIS